LEGRRVEVRARLSRREAATVLPDGGCAGAALVVADDRGSIASLANIPTTVMVIGRLARLPCGLQLSAQFLKEFK